MVAVPIFNVVLRRYILVVNIVFVDKNLCIGCGACVKMCPKKILYIDKITKKCAVTDETKCDRRGGCERVCPVKAIRIKN